MSESERKKMLEGLTGNNRDGQIFLGGRRKRNKKAYFSSAGLAFSVLPDPNPRPAV
jgi:hypothetical protein